VAVAAQQAEAGGDDKAVGEEREEREREIWTSMPF
jgi:hypothetical protein